MSEVVVLELPEVKQAVNELSGTIRAAMSKMAVTMVPGHVQLPQQLHPEWVMNEFGQMRAKIAALTVSTLVMETMLQVLAASPQQKVDDESTKQLVNRLVSGINGVHDAFKQKVQKAKEEAAKPKIIV